MNLATMQQLLSLAAVQDTLRTNAGQLYVPALQNARASVQAVQDGQDPTVRPMLSGPPESIDTYA